MRNLVFILPVLFLMGCETAQYIPPSERSANNFSITVNQNYDTTWRAIIDYLSSTFYVIDNFEKDSGIVTVSFGASNPEDLVDCGQWNAKWIDAYYQRQKFDGPYVQFLRLYIQGQLSGKMSISVRKVSENQTEVRVNARYILSAEPNEWTFDSGSSSTISVSAMRGSTTTRTCRPTYKAETSILSAVKSIAE